MKIAYVHILPLEYYPPASNFLDLLGRQVSVRVHAYSTDNRKSRASHTNQSIAISRGRSPDPGSNPMLRLLVVLWWHLKTAISLAIFKPHSIIYIEPHSAIAAWLYYRLFRGKARLFIHHHEYYAPVDYNRPGMRIPRLGFRLEKSDLFQRAEWISQTNEDRLRLVRGDNPEVAEKVWHILPNFPPEGWAGIPAPNQPGSGKSGIRLIYVGSASFEDTYIKEIVSWAASHPEEVELHICGYNVAREVWEWLEQEQFSNVSFDSSGYRYEELPEILSAFDVGLVLYKGNTSNFVYNVPNKVFEYLACGLEVWYPSEMLSIRKFQQDNPAPLRELRFPELEDLQLGTIQSKGLDVNTCVQFTAERAFAPLFDALGVDDWGVNQ